MHADPLFGVRSPQVSLASPFPFPFLTWFIDQDRNLEKVHPEHKNELHFIEFSKFLIFYLSSVLYRFLEVFHPLSEFKRVSFRLIGCWCQIIMRCRNSLLSTKGLVNVTRLLNVEGAQLKAGYFK